MTHDEFWKLVESAAGDADRLQASLEKLKPEQIIAFDEIFDEHRSRAYDWSLWGAAYLLNGGCSDDGFDYFRCWLIAQGRKVYESALKDPDAALASFAGNDDLENEEFLYAAVTAYEATTGEQMPPRKHAAPKSPRGTAWEEDDLDARFPKITARLNG